MSRKALDALYQGRFLCPVTMPDEFQWILSDEGMATADAWLRQVGLRVASTSERSVFFAVPVKLSKEDRKGISRAYLSIRDKAKPLLEFIDLVSRIGEGETNVAMESQIRLTTVYGASEENNAITGIVDSIYGRLLAKKGKAPQSDTGLDRLRKVFNALVDEGFLVVSNHDLEIYRVTGKMEYARAVLEMLADNGVESGDIPDTAEASQEDLGL